MNHKLAGKINKMAEKDQQMRKSVFRYGNNFNSKIDEKNTELLKKIIEKFGWPVIQLVGKKASNNAWLLVQHAVHDHSFQKKALGLMKKSEKKSPGSIKLDNIAYLTDRILLAEGKKQEFGTQFYYPKENGYKLRLRPIHDRKNLNKRRAFYGLGPVEKYIKGVSMQILPKRLRK